MRLVSSTGWSVVLPEDFIEKDSKDSWRAHNPQGSRVIYVASLDVGSSAARPGADQIAQSAFKDDTGVIDFKSGPVVGRARVSAQELANPYPRTPAMAAGVSDHVWKIEEIVELLK